MNQPIHRAKSDYIKNHFHDNSRNPKKFLRIIDNLINPSKGTAYEIRFYDKVINDYVENGSWPDFLNDHCINIVRILGIQRNDTECSKLYHVDSVFSLIGDMPTLDEVVKIIC